MHERLIAFFIIANMLHLNPIDLFHVIASVSQKMVYRLHISVNANMLHINLIVSMLRGAIAFMLHLDVIAYMWHVGVNAECCISV